MPIRSLLAVERNSRNSEGEGASEKNENPRSAKFKFDSPAHRGYHPSR